MGSDILEMKEQQFLQRLRNKITKDTQIKNRISNSVKIPNANIYNTERSLIDEFTDNALKINAEVVVCNETNVAENIKKLCDPFKKEEIVSWDEPQFSLYGLNDWLNKETQVWPLENRAWINYKNLKVGITSCDVALAESGTVVLMSNPNRGRTVSLLPEIHIVIIRESQIVYRLTEAMKIIEESNKTSQIPSCINFITGPSNSADIEMNLVVGVHGPIKTVYIVVAE